MIDIQELSVSYRTSEKELLALNNINLKIEDGDIVAVIGPSGCGKSTLLNVLSGIINNYAGNVLVNGNPINPSKQRIGLVLQNYGLLPWKTVYENIIIGRRLKDGKDFRDSDYVDYILRETGLREVKNRFPKELSGGQKQRVAIARAFVLRPDVLLMDEPFSALDEITREEAQDLFLKVWEENRVSTVFITHSIEEALYIGRRIVILSQSPGEIIKVYDNPLFGKKDLRLDEEYYRFTIELRKLVKERWSRL
jgi:NitT/TauT family transport system ATP-binding protein